MKDATIDRMIKNRNHLTQKSDGFLLFAFGHSHLNLASHCPDHRNGLPIVISSFFIFTNVFDCSTMGCQTNLLENTGPDQKRWAISPVILPPEKQKIYCLHNRRPPILLPESGRHQTVSAAISEIKDTKSEDVILGEKTKHFNKHSPEGQ